VDVYGSQMFDAPGSDNESEPDAHAPLSHSRSSHKEPTSSQIGFYSGHWSRILVSAKARFRLYVHIDVAFPERNDKNMKHASDCLLEVIQEYVNENKRITLDAS
jgi:hypothetical protein